MHHTNQIRSIRSLTNETASPQSMQEPLKLRASYKSGGIVDLIDQEILELEQFVGLRPMNAEQAAAIEEMKDRLYLLYEIRKYKP